MAVNIGGCFCYQKTDSIQERGDKDWWSLISEEEKESIEKGIFEADNNELKSHSEARKLYGKWLYILLDPKCFRGIRTDNRISSTSFYG
jgi:hypothetical protein